MKYATHGSGRPLLDFPGPRQLGHKALFVFSLTAILSLLMFSPAPAQDAAAPKNRDVRIRGTVINSVTREPIGRALVFSPDNHFATMTDSEGHFEFAFSVAADSGGGGPSVLSARKPGYLSDPAPDMQDLQTNPGAKDLEIELVPEALVVGHVTLPTSEAPDPIEVELLRRQVQDGRAVWMSRGIESTKSNGEFRFAELAAGTYKLLTHEQLDRDPDPARRQGQAFAYPPVYFPNAPDFSAAAPIQLSAGMTFQAELALAKREYYQVKVPVLNPQSGAVSVAVSVQGHKGPGYDLGYDQREQAITGMLPDGHYTLEASSYEPNTASGVVNIVVNGAAMEGPRLVLLPDRSIKVNVKEEFTSGDNAVSPGGAITGGIRRMNQQRQGHYLNVMLQPADDFGQGRGGNTRPSPADDSLVIDNVQPGRYWLRVFSSRGFASAITSGGTDLLHQPLVVGLGGTSPPIEVTMRDDGAQIDGAIEGADNTGPASAGGLENGMTSPVQYQPYAFVYCVPLPDSPGQFTEAGVSPDGKFTATNLPPGAYRLLAFKHPQPELEYRNPEAMRAYDSKGLVVRLLAGQTEHVRLPIVSPSE